MIDILRGSVAGPPRAMLPQHPLHALRADTELPTEPVLGDACQERLHDLVFLIFCQPLRECPLPSEAAGRADAQALLRGTTGCRTSPEPGHNVLKIM